MIDYLTFIPWPWWVVGLIVIAGLLWLANWFMDRPPTEFDDWCAEVDRELTEEEARARVRPLASGVHLVDDPGLREIYIDRDLGGWRHS